MGRFVVSNISDRGALDSTVANLWLTSCFALSCYFYGAGVNPLLAVPAVIGPLGIMALTPAAAYETLRRTTPVLFYGCLMGVVLIVLHYLLLARSADNSFIPSVVLACLPLWVLTTALLKNPRQLWLMLSVVVAVFAAFTVLEFGLSQQRAHAPLRDPGNFATLLYLVWLPWLIAMLGREVEPRVAWLNALALSVFLLAMLATHLRFAMLLVGAVPVLLLLAWWRYSLAFKRVLPALVAVAVSLCLYLLLDASGMSSAFASGASPAGMPEAEKVSDPRLLLWHSTWQAIVSEGGWHGAGLAAFAELYPQFRSVQEQVTVGMVTHNDLLQMWLEGGMWLFVPMLLLYIGIALVLLRLLWRGQQPNWQLGWLMGLALALLHATVNFVFYILPLLLLMGVILGLAFRSDAQDEQQPSVGWQGHCARVAFPLGLVLALGGMLTTITTMGVLHGYRQAPLTAYLQANDARLTSFARVTQVLHPGRGGPIWIEARLLARRFAEQPTDGVATQAQLAYAAVIAAQPWNPQPRLEYADLQGRMLASGVVLDDRRDTLYRRAQSLSPYSAATNAALINWEFARGDQSAGLALIDGVADWCGLMGREDEAGRFFRDLAAAADQLGAPRLVERLETCAEGAGRDGGTGRRIRPLMRFFGG